jgi:hypothetical protein
MEGAEGRVCSDLDLPAARALPGQSFHREVSARLTEVLEQIM